MKVKLYNTDTVKKVFVDEIKSKGFQQIQQTAKPQPIQQIKRQSAKTQPIQQIKRQSAQPQPIQHPITVDGVEIDVIYKSMDLLKKWSNKTQSNIIFDSKIDGDGWTNNVLGDRVFKKRNLYFISFNGYGDTYGGYLSERINIYNKNIRDEHIFVFSLTRKGKTKNIKYNINREMLDATFKLFYKDQNEELFRFGDDISTCKVDSNKSWCSQYRFIYNEENALSKAYPKCFRIKRIVVIEMAQLTNYYFKE
ncbi:TLDc domain-containing protein [Entamoeba marina]